MSEDLRAEVDRLTRRLVEVEAERDEMGVALDRVHAAEKHFLSRAVEAEHALRVVVAELSTVRAGTKMVIRRTDEPASYRCAGCGRTNRHVSHRSRCPIEDVALKLDPR